MRNRSFCLAADEVTRERLGGEDLPEVTLTKQIMGPNPRDSLNQQTGKVIQFNLSALQTRLRHRAIQSEDNIALPQLKAL